ncbi:hypothetical protein IKA15_00955 [bacterium]|nr:hypothetical protein [bacterium]
MKKILTILLLMLFINPASAFFKKEEEPKGAEYYSDTDYTTPIEAKKKVKYKPDKKIDAIDSHAKYKKVTKDASIIQALDMLDGTAGEFSQSAILGNNLSEKPIIVEFANLANFDIKYANFDALGWKQKDRLYIYINVKHQDAPKEALAALLAHEAIHQDELNSLNEETYAWTLEAVVWQQLLDENPAISKIEHPLVERENIINKLFVKGNYTNEYIRKSVISNIGYQSLPSRSPGFEDER